MRWWFYLVEFDSEHEIIIHSLSLSLSHTLTSKWNTHKLLCVSGPNLNPKTLTLIPKMNTLDNSPELLRHSVGEQSYASEEKKTSRGGGWSMGEDEEVKKFIVPRPGRPVHESPPFLRGG